MKWTVLRCSSHSWEQPLRLKASSASHAQTNLQKRANSSLSLLRFHTFTYDILSEATLPPQHFETVVKKNKKNVTWHMTHTRRLSHAMSAVRRKTVHHVPPFSAWVWVRLCVNGVGLRDWDVQLCAWKVCTNEHAFKVLFFFRLTACEVFCMHHSCSQFPQGRQE